MAAGDWGLVLLIAAVHGFAFYDRLLVAFLAPLVKAALALTDTELGVVLGAGFALIFSCTSFAFMIGGLGRDRRGALPAAIVAWSVATAACGLATSFAALLAARLLMGVAQAALSPLALPMIAQAVPGAVLGRAVAIYTSASTLGRSAAMLGGAFVLSFIAAPLAGRDGWRLLFALSALPNLGLALILHARTPAVPTPPILPIVPAMGPPSASLRAWARVNARWLAGLCITTSAAVLVVQTITAWATSLLARRFGLSVVQAGTLFGLVILAAAPAGQAVGGWLIDRVPPRRARGAPTALISGALVAALPFAAALARAATPATAAAALVGLTFILAVATPLGPFGIQAECPPHLRRRATAGLLGLISAIGFGLGPAVVGVLTDRLFGPGGIGSALFSLCVAAAVVGVGAATLTSDRRRDR